MSDVTYVGSRLKSFETTPQFDGYTQVVIKVTDGVEFSAGNDLGRTLHLSNPWGTQEMANNVLNLVQGFQYQPYAASDAQVEPAAELGDGITIHNVYSGLYKQQTRYGRLTLSDVSAPTEHVIDHEYPYVPKQDRKVIRSLNQISSKLTVQADLISAEVAERKSETERIFADLSIKSEAIAAKVSKSGGDSKSFGWILDDSSWTIKANSADVLKATREGLEIYGKITATGGKIGGFDITSNSLAYNNMDWDSEEQTGIYIGPLGIRLGSNFKVDSAGNLTAASGTFSGNVRAGSIQYGGEHGTLSASGLTDHSITGTQIGYGAVSTSYTSSGINTSLGYADFANGVFQGWNSASNMLCTTMNVSGKNFKFAGRTCYLGSQAVTTALGGTATIQFIGWY